METTVLTRSNLILLMADVAGFRELIADILTDLQDMGLASFITAGPNGDIVGVQATLAFTL